LDSAEKYAVYSLELDETDFPFNLPSGVYWVKNGDKVTKTGIVR
jgi:hypothetical protein